MTRKKFAAVFAVIMLCAVAAVLFLPSCSGKKEPPADLVVWSGFVDKELITLKDLTAKFNAENNLHVTVINVPFNELKVKYQVAAPAGQGPDLVTGPMDWVGPFVAADLVSQVTDTEFTAEQKKNYNTAAIDSVKYDGNIYAIPLFMETVAIIYNKDIVPKEPKTMDELIETGAAFNKPADGKYGFFFDITNFYFSWAFFAGNGSEIFGTTDGKMDINKVMLDSPSTIQTLEYLSAMRNKYKLIPDGATTDMMNGIFFEKNLQFSINGPWVMADLRKKGINFEVMPMPPLANGQRPRPFLGLQGVMLNKQAKNRELAVKFMHYINQPENQKAMCLASGRIPSRLDTLDLIKDQTEILKFAEAAKYAYPMPNHPAMGQVWEPMGQALRLVIIDGKDAREVMKLQVERIQSNIKMMME
ncbi:MAG: maltose ABC transporter substrate-binding protein [Firmicutes bacterium]|nr:maltose ABC transporter substrate-binding protein [Bacillota bacterium]